MVDTSKVWLITGASSNFGVALTHALLKAGHRVVATARTPSKLPLEADDALLTLRLDVTDLSSISQAFDDAKQHFGRIDVVVNKAGSATETELEGLSADKAYELFASQLWGPARVQEMATGIFETQGSPGLILNISSVSGVFAVPLATIMCASKAGTEILTLARARSSPFVDAVNIRPGGFEDHPHAHSGPQPYAYSKKAVGRTVADMVRSMLSDQPPGQGDVHKMAEALIALAESPRERLPGAVLLGSDAYSVTLAAAAKRVAHIQHGQRLLQKLRRVESRAKDARVWLVANADSILGQTLVRVLLASGYRVAAVSSSNEMPSLNDDQLFAIRSNLLTADAISAVLHSVMDHFGRVDVIVNAPLDDAQPQQDDWEETYALAERIFWSPMSTASAALKVLRELNPPGAGGRILNILATVSAEDSTVAVHSAMNAALNIGTTALARELPRKWNIGVAAITIDSDLHADDATARTLIALAELPRSALPSQLPIGPRALGIAERVTQVELSETCSKEAMVRAFKTDRDHIDSRARAGLFQSLLLILSPSPSIITWLTGVLAVLGWGIRLAVLESLKKLLARK